MKAYELTVMERLMALSVLPKETNIANLRIKQNLVGKIGLADEEYAEYEIKENGPQISWNPGKGKVPKKIDLKDREAEMIREGLRTLDAQNKLTMEHVSLYEKFVDEKGEKDDSNTAGV